MHMIQWSNLRTGCSRVKYYPCFQNLLSNYFDKTSARHRFSASHICGIRRTMASGSVLLTRYDDVLSVYAASVQSVLPKKMIYDVLSFDSEHSELKIQKKTYVLDRNVYVVGFGKAVLGMTKAVDEILSDHIREGIVSVPIGIQQTFRDAGKRDLLLDASSQILVREGALHNLPDDESLRASIDIQQLVQGLTVTDLLIILISGGGSALLPCPIPPITLEEMSAVARVMASHGANITEINMVRKNIDSLKGGGLVQLAYPAQVVALVLSDIIGDSLEFIASGTTVPSRSTPQQCLEILNHLRVMEKIPQSILTYLVETAAASGDTVSDHNLEIEKKFAHVFNCIVGSNTIAVQGAVNQARGLGFIPYVLSTGLSGDVRHVAKIFSGLAKFVLASKQITTADDYSVELKRELAKIGKDSVSDLIRVIKMSHDTGKPLCILAAGETTVKVTGSGKGGRSQELGLAVALELNEMYRSIAINKGLQDACVMFLSAGTDGIDGPTDAAGSIIDWSFCSRAEQAGMDIRSYLDNNDAYNLLNEINAGQSLINTGHTGTNVMDIQVLLVQSGVQTGAE